MGELDELSRVVGRIEQAVHTNNSNAQTLIAEQKKINEVLIEHSTILKQVVVRQAETEKTVEDYKAVKNRGIGAIFGISLASGSIGAGLATVLSRVFGGGHG